ncbi:MAG: hypothetical protein GTO15_06405 [Pseudomonas stutzeri]|nr:hypothetical protein [Stutzerimonas stutzeri]
MSHFGPKVIGEEVYQEQKQLAEEGRLHFGPKVVGPYKESAHGPRVVDERKTLLDAAFIKAVGSLKGVTEMKVAQLEAVCTELGIQFKPRTPKPVLIKMIELWSPNEPQTEEETPEEE